MADNDPPPPRDMVPLGATMSALAIGLASLYRETGPERDGLYVFPSFLLLGGFLCLVVAVMALQTPYNTWKDGPVEYHIFRLGLFIIGTTYLAILIHTRL